MSDLNNIILNGATYNIGGSGSDSGLNAGIKEALLQIASKVAYIDEDGQDYYDDLYDALYPPTPPATLVSISAVYTQSGTVYDTDTLDSLKPDLVVTALYDDSSTTVVTNYTLSGTLTEGTSIITVSYGGKTTTFSVTVTQWSTAPVIAEYDKTINSNYNLSALTGSCITVPYSYTMPINAFKETSSYDTENNYAKVVGTLFKLMYYAPNSNSIAFSSKGKSVNYDGSNTPIGYISTNRTEESVWQSERYKTAYFTSDGDVVSFVFNLTTADLANSYAYWVPALTTGLLPVGVEDGDIIFAGENTPYYNKRNIND